MIHSNVLVVGKRGQVARALEAGCPRHGITLSCLGRPELDILNEGDIRRAFARHAPEIVVNAAAYTAVDQAETEPEAARLLNAEAAGILAGVAAEHGIPIIHLSTDYVFSGDKLAPYQEADPVSPLGVYGASKLEGEYAVSRANSRAVILRTAWVYSPWGKNFARTMLRLARQREEVAVVCDQRGNPTSALDIATGIWSLIALHSRGGMNEAGVFHMTARGDTSWAGFAEEIFRQSAQFGGPFARVRPIPASDYPTPARRPADSRLDSSRLAQVFGISLPDWRSGVAPVVKEIIAMKDPEE